MSSGEQSDGVVGGPTGDAAVEPAAEAEWGPHAYVEWLGTSVGREFIEVKKGLSEARRGAEPRRYRWPADLRGKPMPTEGPLRLWVAGPDSTFPPEGWVGVVGYDILRKMLLSQLVVEISVTSAGRVVDFISENYRRYGVLFWPRDGITVRGGDRESIATLTRRIESLTDFAEVKLVLTSNSAGHHHFATQEQRQAPGGGTAGRNDGPGGG